MVLSRKWWKTRSLAGGSRDDNYRFSLPTVDDFQPLDTQEQEEMVRSFERTHEQQSRLWRGVFAAFLLGYVGFLIHSIFQQAWNPWELRYHAYFMEDVPSWMVISADMVASIACLLALKGMLQSSISHQQLIWHSFYVGLLLAVFWSYFMSSLPSFHWDLLWLPFGPLRYFARISASNFRHIYASLGYPFCHQGFLLLPPVYASMLTTYSSLQGKRSELCKTTCTSIKEGEQ